MTSMNCWYCLNVMTTWAHALKPEIFRAKVVLAQQYIVVRLMLVSILRIIVKELDFIVSFYG